MAGEPSQGGNEHRGDADTLQGDRRGAAQTTARDPGRNRTRRTPSNRFDRTIVRIADLFKEHAYRWVQLSFAFVFFYFGLQKWPIIQGASPVRPPVKAFVEAVGFGGWIPLAPEAGLLFIGIFEVTMGLLWFATVVEERSRGTSHAFVPAAIMTVVHQLVTFLPLILVPAVAFRQTQLLVPLVGTAPIGVALDWLSAFILKNLLFFGAFFYVYAEWVERFGPGVQASTPAAEPSSPDPVQKHLG